MRGGLVITVLAATTLVPRSCAESPPPDPAHPRHATVALVGDLLPDTTVLDAAHRSAAGTTMEYDFEPLLRPVASLVSDADLAICHMETPIGREGERAGRYGRTGSRGWRMLMPVEVALAVAATGFDRCTTASNHSFDFGAQGVVSTLDALDDAGLSHAGTAPNPAAVRPALLLINGVRVAHLAYTNTTNTPLPTGAPWLVAWGDVDRVVADVVAARAIGAEVVIVSLHMGEEGASRPTREQRRWADAVTSRARVDLVVMHGPHTVEPVEVVNGTWVFWSVGNLLSGMGPGAPGIYGSPRMLDGLLAWASFDEDPSGSGGFTTTVSPIALCAYARTVYPATRTLADAATAPTLATSMSACLRRTRAVVPEAA